MAQCTAKTKAGDRCTIPAVRGESLCFSHGPKAKEAQQRAVAASAAKRRDAVAQRQHREEEAKLGLDGLLKLRALEHREELAAAVISKAKAGDVQAMKLIYDRAEGRAIERIATFPDNEAPIPLSEILASLAEIDSLPSTEDR